MRRILMLLSVAAMLAAAMALSGVAQAKPIINTKADAKCLAEAAKTVKEPGFNPANYTFHGGDTDPSHLSDDFTGQGTLEGNDVFCGFREPNFTDRLEAGDIFISGAQFDGVGINNGTVYGQEGGDLVGTNSGTFYGGAGADFVIDNFGTYYGQEGNDGVDINHPEGTFDGGADDDSVNQMDGGTFDGGDGTGDSVSVYNGGCVINVEIGVVNGTGC
jgi:hypothetical protein